MPEGVYSQHAGCQPDPACTVWCVQYRVLGGREQNTTQVAKLAREAEAMLAGFAEALNKSGLGQPVGPNQPGVKLTAFCVIVYGGRVLNSQVA